MLLGGYFLANFTIHATIQYWYLVCIFAFLEIGYHFFHSHFFQGIQLNKKNSAAIQSRNVLFLHITFYNFNNGFAYFLHIKYATF